LHPAVGLVAALDAISLRTSTRGKVLAGQRMSRMATRSTLAGYMLGLQLLQQLQHELLPERLRSGRIDATEVSWLLPGSRQRTGLM